MLLLVGAYQHNNSANYQLYFTHLVRYKFEADSLAACAFCIYAVKVRGNIIEVYKILSRTLNITVPPDLDLNKLSYFRQHHLKLVAYKIRRC